MGRNVECSSSVKGFQWNPGEVDRLVRFLDAQADYPIPPGDLAIGFFTSAEMQGMHERFFDDPSDTDVMTFPGMEEDEHAGDIAIGVDYGRASARAHATDLSHELTLYIVHAWLHLGGYRDDSDEAIARIRAAEAVLMERIQSEGCMPSFA